MSLRVSIIVAALAVSAQASAQQLDLPKPSPAAKFSQTVGLTDISIEYSSPAVRGRPIWGALVPYGQVWRAGANEATKVTFAKDVKIGETAVPAGSYAFFVIPNEGKPWTLILNKDYGQWGSMAYKQELDVVRVDVQPEAIAPRERLAILVTDFTNDEAKISLEWEKVRVSMPVTIDTKAQVLAAIKATDENLWKPLNRAARYHLEQTKDFAAGLALVDKSLKLQVDWSNTWTRAQLLHELGKNKDAYAAAESALKLGEAGKSPSWQYYSADVKKALAEWKKK